MSEFRKNVTVITGTGGIGLAIARSLALNTHLVLADYSPTQLDAAAQVLRDEGHTVTTHATDVADWTSVQSLAETAVQVDGPIATIVHTAGVSPVQAPPARIYEVDLLGTAHVIDAFLPVVGAGATLTVIASMVGHYVVGKLSPEFETHLATAPVSSLLSHPQLDSSGFDRSDPAKAQAMTAGAYSVSKRGNILRVQAAARAWGLKGARINSVSPGVINTPMSRMEAERGAGAHIQKLVDESPMRRKGTASDIAAMVAFLASPAASFLTGSDYLVDGGSVAVHRWGGE